MCMAPAKLSVTLYPTGGHPFPGAVARIVSLGSILTHERTQALRTHLLQCMCYTHICTRRSAGLCFHRVPEIPQGHPPAALIFV